VQVAELRYYIINFPNGFSSGFAAALSAENTDWTDGIRDFAFAGSNYIANITRIDRNSGKLSLLFRTLLQKYACDNSLPRYCTLRLDHNQFRP